MVNQVPVWQLLTQTPAQVQAASPEVHWAMQIVASVGASLIPWREDHQNTSLRWDSRGWLVSQEARPGKSLEAALQIGNMHLLFLAHPQGKNYDSIAELILSGHTLDAAYTWMEDQLADYLNRSLEHLRRLDELPWDLPRHPLAGGSIFMIARAAFQELQHAYSNSYLLLNPLQEHYQTQASQLLTWPQDMEMRFTLRQVNRQIQVGFTPASAEIKQPHWFVRPLWSIPAEQQQAMPIGQWEQNQGVLHSAELLSFKEASQQHNQVWSFFNQTLNMIMNLPHSY